MANLKKPKKSTGVTTREGSPHYWCNISVKGFPRVRQSLSTNDLDLAYRIAHKLRNEIVEGRYFNKKKRIFFKDCLKDYFTQHLSRSKSAKTRGYYLLNFQKFFLSKYGEGIYLDEINDSNFASYIRHRQQTYIKHTTRFVSDSTIRKEISMFQHMNDMAEDVWGVSGSSISVKNHKKRLGTGRSLENYLTDEQFINYVKRLPEYLVVPVLFQNITGLRWGNVKKFDKSDLDWGRLEMVFLVKSPSKDDKKHVIPITPEIENLLVMAGVTPNKKERGFVFTYLYEGSKKDLQGKLLPLGDHRKAMKKAYYDAGVKLERGQVTHLIRHTSGTNVLRSTGNLKKVQRLLGHAKITTSAKYSHLTDNELVDAMQSGAKAVTNLSHWHKNGGKKDD